MKYRKFGKTDLEVSEIGFGCWAIGGDAVVGDVAIGWGPADDKTSVDAINTAIELGINFFDTADFYGLGHSEELLGKTLRGKNDVIVATKVGHRAIDNSIKLDYSRNYIIEACETSLKRLQRDAIDLYQLHSARLNHFETEECIEAMEELKSQGKIRYWGLSLNTFVPQPEAGFLMQKNKGDGFQLVHNLINLEGSEIINAAGNQGYGIIARMPLQFGLLTGKFSTEQHFEKTDHRHFRLTPEVIAKSLTILEEQIWPLTSKYNTTKTGLALSFILGNKNVSTVIPGIRTKQQAIDNVSGIVELESDDLQVLTDLYKTNWKEIFDMMKVLG